MDKSFLVPLQPLNNIDITNSFKYESRFNRIFSRNHIPRPKDGAYDSKRTNWVSLFIGRKLSVYFGSFGT